MKKILCVSLFAYGICHAAVPLRDFLTLADVSSALYNNNSRVAQQGYEQLVVSDPSNTDYLHGLADSFYVQGNFKQAGAYYQQALANEPGELGAEKLYFNSGCTHAQLHEFKEALKSFEHVVVINSNNERAKKNIEILKKLLEQQKQQPKKSENQKSKDGKEKNKDQQNQPDNQSNRDQNNQQGDQKQQQQDNKNQTQNEPKSGANNQQTQKQDQPGNEQRQPQHTQSSSQKSSSTQNAMLQKVKQLDQKLKTVLSEVDKLDQYGQHLYLQAVAGQHEGQKRSEHDW
jgi:Ca-activated chloride channel family protein